MGAEKRPTDHLEPAPKKRGSERQITKDDVSEEEEQHEPGTFARASEDVIRQRKIVRARRGLQASVPPASDQPANPFANIQLMPTTVGPAAETGEPKATADANQNTVSEPAQKTEVTNEPQEEERTENNGKQEEDIEKPEKVGNKEPANKHQDAKPTVGFGGFGALASNPAGGLAFGLASGSNTMGFKGFSSLASDTSATAFGSASASSYPSLLVNTAASVFGSNTLTAQFGSDKETQIQAGKPQLPEEIPRETGEESESTLFSGNGVLFEWSDAAKQWRERGRGEVRVNINTSSGQGRIVMRQKGNLRVLLNANLWADMVLTLMDGKAGVTFACINHVPTTDTSEESASGQGDGKLMTYALRISPSDTLDTFINVVNENKRRSAA